MCVVEVFSRAGVAHEGKFFEKNWSQGFFSIQKQLIFFTRVRNDIFVVIITVLVRLAFFNRQCFLIDNLNSLTEASFLLLIRIEVGKFLFDVQTNWDSKFYMSMARIIH